jgi:putative transposase
MLISLYSGGMTVRDIQHHLARTIGTDLSHETISKVTDAVVEEVQAWQSRPLEAVYPIVYLDALVVKVRDGHQVRNNTPGLVSRIAPKPMADTENGPSGRVISITSRSS